MKPKYIDHPSIIRCEYKGRSVRFRQVEEEIVYIAVADLTNLFMCHNINWYDLNSNCGSCAKITFYQNKNASPIYAIEAYDLSTLCRLGCHGILSQRNQKIIEWVKQKVQTIKNKANQKMDNKNSIQIFSNPQFGQIRMAGTPEHPLFCLADICKVVELKNPSSVKARLDKEDIQLIDLHDLNPTEGPYIGNSQANFINEPAFYDVILQSCSPKVKPFRKWVTSEVLPSIRKHGAYMTDDILQKALASPDFLIQLATQLKEEQQKNKALQEDNSYKNSVIEGLTEKIPLADMRQRITQIMRKGGVSTIKEAYHLLYDEFDKKYHMNLSTRMNNVMYEGSKLDYIEKELKMLPELYELTCKLFESQYETLMASWGKTVKRAQGNRH